MSSKSDGIPHLVAEPFRKEKAPPTNAKGRVCKTEGCGAKLSIYNQHEYCAPHHRANIAWGREHRDGVNHVGGERRGERDTLCGCGAGPFGPKGLELHQARYCENRGG